MACEHANGRNKPHSKHPSQSANRISRTQIIRWMVETWDMFNKHAAALRVMPRRGCLQGCNACIDKYGLGCRSDSHGFGWKNKVVCIKPMPVMFFLHGRNHGKAEGSASLVIKTDTWHFWVFGIQFTDHYESEFWNWRPRSLIII